MNENLHDAVTKPTVETILERINALGETLQKQITELRIQLQNDIGSVSTDLGSLQNEFYSLRGEVEIRLDRIEGMTNQTRAEMLTLRAYFKEFLTQPRDSQI
jgi:hypothetical protein